MKIFLLDIKQIINNLNKIEIELLDLVMLGKCLSKAFLKFYKISKKNQAILFINEKKFPNLYKETIKITKNPFINAKWKSGLISNWGILKKNLILYKWLLKYIYIIKNNNIKLKLYYIIKIYRCFIKMHPFYKGLINIKHLPNYIFLSDSSINNSIIKELLKSKISIISITSNKYFYKLSTIPIWYCFYNKNPEIILNLIVLACVQGFRDLNKISI